MDTKSDYTIYAALCLTKEQMDNEIKLNGEQSAHGKDGISGYRIDMKFGSKILNRFIEKYQFNESILESKIMDKII